MTFHNYRLLVLSSVGVCCLTNSTRAEVTAQQIAPLTSGANQNILTPSLNDAGEAAFAGTGLTGQGVVAFFRMSSPATTNVVAEFGSNALFDDLQLSVYFSSLPIDASGRAYVSGQRSLGSTVSESGIFRGLGAPGNPSKTDRANTPTALLTQQSGTNTSTIPGFYSYRNPIPNATGDTVLFSAGFTPNGVASDGIHTWDGTTVRSYIDSSHPTVKPKAYLLEEVVKPLDMNDAGQVAFMALNTNRNATIYIGQPDGSSSPVISTQSMPQFSNLGFYDILSLADPRLLNSGVSTNPSRANTSYLYKGASLNDAGDLLFRATLRNTDTNNDGIDDEQAIYLREADGDLVKVADTLGGFKHLWASAINNNGTIVFEAETDDGLHGIYHFDGASATKLIGTGDTISYLSGGQLIERTIAPSTPFEISVQGAVPSARGLLMGEFGLNDLDQLAFYARFNPVQGVSGTPQGIFTITVPEPASAGAAAFVLSMLLRRRR